MDVSKFILLTLLVGATVGLPQESYACYDREAPYETPIDAAANSQVVFLGELVKIEELVLSEFDLHDRPRLDHRKFELTFRVDELLKGILSTQEFSIVVDGIQDTLDMSYLANAGHRVPAFWFGTIGNGRTTSSCGVEFNLEIGSTYVVLNSGEVWVSSIELIEDASDDQWLSYLRQQNSLLPNQERPDIVDYVQWSTNVQYWQCGEGIPQGAERDNPMIPEPVGTVLPCSFLQAGFLSYWADPMEGLPTRYPHYRIFGLDYLGSEQLRTGLAPGFVNLNRVCGSNSCVGYRSHDR